MKLSQQALCPLNTTFLQLSLSQPSVVSISNLTFIELLNSIKLNKAEKPNRCVSSMPQCPKVYDIKHCNAMYAMY